MTDWRWLRQVILRLRTLLQRDRVERDLEEEFQFHIEQRIEMEVSGYLDSATRSVRILRHTLHDGALGDQLPLVEALSTSRSEPSRFCRTWLFTSPKGSAISSCGAR